MELEFRWASQRFALHMHIDSLPNFFSIISGRYIKAHVLFNSCSIDTMQTDAQILLYRC